MPRLAQRLNLCSVASALVTWNMGDWVVACAQDQLQLTPEQQETMLRARQLLLKRLAQASDERQAAYAAVGLDAAAVPRVRGCALDCTPTLTVAAFGPLRFRCPCRRPLCSSSVLSFSALCILMRHPRMYARMHVSVT